MTPVKTIREDLLAVLALSGIEKISFDNMEAGEIEQAIIISEFSLEYQDRQLDMTYYRGITVTAQLVAKTAGDLDEMVDNLAEIDNQSSGSVLHAMVQRVVYETDDSPDYKIAVATISAEIVDYE